MQHDQELIQKMLPPEIQLDVMEWFMKHYQYDKKLRREEVLRQLLSKERHGIDVIVALETARERSGRYLKCQGLIGFSLGRIRIIISCWRARSGLTHISRYWFICFINIEVRLYNTT